jgi:hypothetical protein
MPKTPATPNKAVRLEAFDIQGHNGAEPFDYVAFFDFIAQQDSKTRRETVADRFIAVPNFTKYEGQYAFVAYAGSTDRSFLVLDLEEETEEVRQIESGKVIATRTVGLIDPVARRVIVQYVHTGVRAAQIATLFEKLARIRSKEFEGATLEFAPTPGRTFRQELAAMKRIQSASVTLTRPNIDWNDFSNAANSLAEDTNAHNITVSAVAGRNQSLSKAKGLIHTITEVISQVEDGAKSILKAVVIKGMRDDESALTTLNLTKHIDARMVKVPLESDGLPNPGAVTEASLAFMNDPKEGS